MLETQGALVAGTHAGTPSLDLTLPCSPQRLNDDDDDHLRIHQQLV